MKYLVLLLVLIGFTEIAFSEPQSYEDFMKTYHPILDRVHNEKLSPHKQIDIGLHMRDVVCLDGRVQVLQFSSQSYVACVNPDTATILVKRGWGAVMYDETKYSDGHGYECSMNWIIQYDEIKPKHSEVIYALRHTMNNIQESLIWNPIIVNDMIDSPSICIQEDSILKMKQSKSLIL
ncbi:Hypothetical protein Nlim_0787 [Candidatus Nitrosarchaeum limnium SFB1]|jgi:hypothetical protein|uniref:Secreted protein n=1 Tax=Candidatus Nitrosarchaeum limnium SFB1 TaxID=886738 RepID=F3KJX8_9ARCH|nr:Hypothetical protein Nlim_0787 [Candidatus Nitrosarchaeum limnium SFB1]